VEFLISIWFIFPISHLKDFLAYLIKNT
jgi:hypothetical protein